MSASPAIQQLRSNLEWWIRLERGASRRARHFERRANNPANPNRAASARAAAGYQSDAAKDRRRIEELRNTLARLEGGAA